jgi:hypothetical protein
MKTATSIIALWISFLLPAVTHADQDVCAQTYANSLNTVDEFSLLLTTLRFQYQRVCGNSSSAKSSDFSGELQAVIKKVPVVGKWTASKKVTNDQSFCREYEADSSLDVDMASLRTVPVVEAQKNFNQCVGLFLKGVTVRHDVGPDSGGVLVHFSLGSPETNFVIQGVRAPGFECSIPRRFWPSIDLDEDSYEHMDRNFNIVCRREPKLVGKDKFYDFATIQIGTNLDIPYSLTINEETIYGPARQSNAATQIRALTKRVSELDLEVKALRGQMEKVKVTNHYFYSHSGPKGLSRAIGEILPFYDVVYKKSDDDRSKYVRNRYCKDAYKVGVSTLYVEPGNCCGNYQFMASCVYLDPVPKPNS